MISVGSSTVLYATIPYKYIGGAATFPVKTNLDIYFISADSSLGSPVLSKYCMT